MNVKLNNADLSGANLNSAYLFNANLNGTNLSGANLEIADLLSANPSNANLRGADFSNSQNLTLEQVTKAKLCQTVLPSNIQIDPNRDCKELGIKLS